MGKSLQLSPELWPLIDVFLFSYIELIFRGGVSCLPAALLFFALNHKLWVLVRTSPFFVSVLIFK